MADKANGKALSLLRRAGAQAYGMMFKTGWLRWLFLAVAAVVLLFAAAIVFGGTDYHRDPSALVPRSAYFYAETRDLSQVFARTGGWPVWKDEARHPEAGQWSGIQVSLAGMIGDKMAGLGTRLPLRWLSGVKMAAFCLAEGEGGNAESWAVYLEAEDADRFLSELHVEPGFSFSRAENAPDGVFKLAGPGAGSLFFGVISPWIIISSDAKLPVFAAESMKKPAFSLANSGVMPGWSRSVAVRGLVNPAYMASQSGGASPFDVMGGWTRPEARLAFSTTLDDEGLMDCRIRGVAMSDRPGGDGVFWTVVRFVLFWIGLLCLFFIVGAVSVMIGWAGWLKVLAVKSGIAPATEPAEANPSAAFREDAGEPAAEPKTEIAAEPENGGTAVKDSPASAESDPAESEGRV